ncbi:hypothetical protein BVG79_p1000193 (plasmid) [Ketogulonicigenium robustum]|uniref:Allophanate hydrolase n=1 Tax=Ketogulonicigenium robustum TaxID=92947 RepID=A0A1W6P3B3_9RHOB|nr:urea amidolyase family protein [Ketogulonicigenium robustum]ARO15995.1 hypothetical protein BVG79_p1000193 [Ketogulonicigenium robustum]
MTPHILPVGADAILVQLDSLDETLALFAALRRAPIAGVTQLLPAAQTILVTFDRTRTTAAQIAGIISQRDTTATFQTQGRDIEIPVTYDGQDLAEVAALTSLTVAEVITRHTATPWRVAFNGFAPGFSYLCGGDPALTVPRRTTPRTAIPAGAVALAGQFAGVYPKASPGGWQIIGTTQLPMFDLTRTPAALLRPGDRVHFVQRPYTRPAPPAPTPEPVATTGMHITATPLPLLLQDLGRAGLIDQGIGPSGAADAGALRALNHMLGNPASTPALEVLGGGTRLSFDGPCVIGVTGATRTVTVNGAPVPSHHPIAIDAGDTVELLPPDSGLYGYIGVRGGFRVPSVLGSAATDTLAQIGPAPITAPHCLALAQAHAAPVAFITPPALPRSGTVTEIDIIMGPRDDWFPPETVARLTTQIWDVTPQSSRVGKRLHADHPLTRPDTRELPSEGATKGAIQVPHSGEPVLFLADHPLTGGYPVIAVVAPHHLDLAAQLPPGAQVRFRPTPPTKDATTP